MGFQTSAINLPQPVLLRSMVHVISCVLRDAYFSPFEPQHGLLHSQLAIYLSTVLESLRKLGVSRRAYFSCLHQLSDCAGCSGGKDSTASKLVLQAVYTISGISILDDNQIYSDQTTTTFPVSPTQPSKVNCFCLKGLIETLPKNQSCNQIGMFRVLDCCSALRGIKILPLRCANTCSTTASDTFEAGSATIPCSFNLLSNPLMIPVACHEG